MSLLENIFVESFLTKKPKDGITIVEGRLKDSMALDMEMAEYFKERAQIEDVYAKSLSKASKRLYTMDPGVLGHFAPVWESLMKEFNQIAEFHSQMAYQILNEIEKPLRVPPSEDYRKLQQLEPTIQTLEHKSKMTSVKGSIFRKNRSNSDGQWESTGVDYLSLHNKIDVARLERLKTGVVKFGQIQLEQLMKRVEMLKTTMESAKEFDIEHDIRDFCAVRGKGLNTIKGRQNIINNNDTLPNTFEKTGSSTISSLDSHRSTNKLKSIFLKKTHSSSGNIRLDDNDQHPRSLSFTHQSPTYSVDDLQHYASVPDQTIPVATQPASSVITSQSVPPFVNGHSQAITATPLIDAEGYSIIPAITLMNDKFPNSNFNNNYSDISTATADDLTVDSNDGSSRLSNQQKLQVQIQQNNLVQKEESEQANESFNKMASILRERTPTVTRRARGRRPDSITRSQSVSFSNTDNALDISNNNSRRSLSSNETIDTSSRSNPFSVHNNTSTEFNNSTYNDATTLPNSSTPVTMPNNNTSLWLQPIPEVLYNSPSIHIYITEKTSFHDPQVHVAGQIKLMYNNNTQAHPNISGPPVSIRLDHIDGIQNLKPNPHYVMTDNSSSNNNNNQSNIYTLNTLNMSSQEPVVCFTYTLTTSALALPIRLVPSWKCVEGISYLMIKYATNALYNKSLSDHVKGGSVQVSMIEKMHIVQSTPEGVWDVPKQRLTWSLHDLLLLEEVGDNNQNRLLAKFYLADEKEQQRQPQPVKLNYAIRDSLVSGISVHPVIVREREEDTSLKMEIITETAVLSENIFFT